MDSDFFSVYKMYLFIFLFIQSRLLPRIATIQRYQVGRLRKGAEKILIRAQNQRHSHDTKSSGAKYQGLAIHIS